MKKIFFLIMLTISLIAQDTDEMSLGNALQERGRELQALISRDVPDLPDIRFARQDQIDALQEELAELAVRDAAQLKARALANTLEKTHAGHLEFYKLGGCQSAYDQLANLIQKTRMPTSTLVDLAGRCASFRHAICGFPDVFVVAGLGWTASAFLVDNATLAKFFIAAGVPLTTICSSYLVRKWWLNRKIDKIHALIFEKLNQ